MDIPQSMQAEFSRWNDGKGIGLESWIGCEGSFPMAVGYASIFWPEFVQCHGYIVRKGVALETIRGFAHQQGSTRQSVEWVVNHLHLYYLHNPGDEDPAKDVLLALGNVLKEIYTAKLKMQFPDQPCEVEFYIPAQEDDLDSYQISFWQTGGENIPATIP